MPFKDRARAAVVAVRGLSEGWRGIASFPALSQTVEVLPSDVERPLHARAQ